MDYSEALKRARTKPISTGVWIPEKDGDFCAGTVKGMREFPSKFKKGKFSRALVIADDAGVETIVFLGAMLLRLIDEMKIKPGDVLVVVFRGEKALSGKRRLAQYAVEIVQRGKGK